MWLPIKCIFSTDAKSFHTYVSASLFRTKQTKFFPSVKVAEIYDGAPIHLNKIIATKENWPTLSFSVPCISKSVKRDTSFNVSSQF